MTSAPTVAGVLVAALVAGCGGAEPPFRKTMVPRSCGSAAFGATTTAATTPATRGLRVGVNFVRGHGSYAVDEAFVEVLRPDAALSGGDLAILDRRNEPVLSVTAKNFPAGDRTLAVTFDGVDSEGRPLPPGRYPVVFAVASHWIIEKCPGKAGASAILTTLDWRG